MLTSYHLDHPDTGESQVLDGWSYFWGAVGGPVYVFIKGFRLLALAMLAITCAVRESLHQADVVESMLIGLQKVAETDDARLSEEVRHLESTVDDLYSAIKYYMTKISRAELDEREGQRWTEIISFTINMEQIGDIIEEYNGQEIASSSALPPMVGNTKIGQSAKLKVLRQGQSKEMSIKIGMLPDEDPQAAN